MADRTQRSTAKSTMKNTVTSLKRRKHTPMPAFDRLPADLRAWLHDAALPWSAASALRLWRQALRDHGGDAQAARNHLSRTEARLIARDARRVWGPTHPSALH